MSMKGYSVYHKDIMGFDDKRVYSLDYSKAIQEFNNKIRRTISKVYVSIEEEDFSDEVASFKRYLTEKCFDGKDKDIEIISRKCPFILFRQKDQLIARVYSWDKPCHEYQEQDIIFEDVILEEIELF